MKLKTADLRVFKANAAGIKPNLLLPVLSYLKFQNSTLTKNNLRSFITQKIDCDQDFLVDERILMNFVEFSGAEEVFITIEGKRIIITDGFTRAESPTEPIENFPTTLRPEGEAVQLEEKVFKALGIAQNFVLDDDIAVVRIHVFLGKNRVCGSNGFVAYMEEVGPIPEIMLRRETCLALMNLTTAKFIENSSYHFFETDTLQFGFVKPEGVWVDFSIYTKIPDGTQDFTLPREEIIKFTEMCITSTDSKVFVGDMHTEDGYMVLNMNDKNFEVDIKKKVKCNGDLTEPFAFNASYLGQTLKKLPGGDDIIFRRSVEKKACFITGPGFVSLIMELLSNEIN